MNVYVFETYAGFIIKISFNLIIKIANSEIWDKSMSNCHLDSLVWIKT